jgi:hypothetical protein
MQRVALSLAAALGLAACSDPDPAEPIGEPEWPTLACETLVDDHCAFPFPSNVFTEADPSTATGRRLALSPEVMPVSYYGVPIDPEPWNARDGFSPGLGLTTFLPGATVDGLPRPSSIARSLEADCPTIVLDTETGERVPHWAELDMSTDDEVLRTFIIRPVVRLESGRRYVVAIRGVRDADGAPVPASPTFAALRDGTELQSDPSVEQRRALYADIFARLADIDVARDDLQIAWDFTTASTEDDTGWLLHMRDEALALVGDAGPEYAIVSVEEAPEDGVALEIEGTMRVPLYLDRPGPGAHLVFGADGLPAPNPDMPWADFPFKVIVPPAAADGPLPLAQFGHGLFSEREEIVWFEIPFSSTHGYVVFATEWIGMAQDDDRLHIATFVQEGNFEEFATVVDRLHQGVLNHLLLMRLMSGRFVAEPAIQFGDHSAIDPSQRYYYGSSQGGIMGGTYMALTTDVERGLLDTAGMPYNLLLPRSVDFDEFFTIIKSNYQDPRDIMFFLALAQILWDRVEPNGWAPHVVREPLPGTQPHRVIVRPAIGDHQVTTLGAHIMARSIGATHVDTGLRDVWGLEKVSPPFSGSALVEYDFGVPPDPEDNLPQRECGDPHDVLRTIPEGQTQLDHFFRTGEVIESCGGPCSFPALSGCP